MILVTWPRSILESSFIFFLFDDILYIFIFTFTRYIKNQSNQNLLTHNYVYLRKNVMLKKKVVRRDLIEFKLSISHVDDIHVYAYIYIYIRLGKLYKNNSEVHSSLLINRNFLTNWQITFIAIFFFFSQYGIPKRYVIL